MPKVIWLPQGVEPEASSFDGAQNHASLSEAVEAALEPHHGLEPWLQADDQLLDRRGILSVRDAAPEMELLLRS